VPVVRVGGKVLEAGVDYDVRYQNNHTLGDNGVCIVVGKGNYSGMITAGFKVVTVKYGDVNRDGKVNAIDTGMVKAYVGKKRQFDSYQMIAADVSGDGRVNAIDTGLLKAYVAKKRTAFPVEA
jgi:hypothetical protein